MASQSRTKALTSRIPLLIDTDANNELDDQHALAYAFFNRDIFDIVGVTVNNTPLGDGIDGQYSEAQRIMHLCDCLDQIPLARGVEGNLKEVLPTVGDSEHDGFAGVDFIVDCARSSREQTLVLVAIGKLTNVALALAKAPDIASRIRLVWLGSNYPYPGEYNLWSDPDAVSYLLSSTINFEIVTVRYRETTGATAVSVEGTEIARRMKGAGPKVSAIGGRHGGMFSTFGDYSISLFEHVNLSRRPLFDVVAVAVVKEPTWGRYSTIRAPELDNLEWVENRSASRHIGIWENFERDAILEDFFSSCRSPRLGSM